MWCSELPILKAFCHHVTESDWSVWFVDVAERVQFLEDMQQRLYEFDDTVQDLSSSLTKIEDNMAANQQDEGQQLGQMKVSDNLCCMYYLHLIY